MAHIVGTNGNDSLVGTSGVDTIEGLAGNDTLVGLAGNDSLLGGLGDDRYVVGTGDVLSDSGGTDTVETSVSWTLGAGFENLTFTGTGVTSGSGNSLDNIITGSAGNNWLRGLEGNDTINAGAGNDTIQMSNGSGTSYGTDVIDGGAGVDTLDFGTAARTAVTVNLESGSVSGGGTGGAGSATVNSVENVNGSAFNDAIVGNIAANFLFGFDGNDTLDGSEGADRLEGGAGNDVLFGGRNSLIGDSAADSLNGGLGDDEYHVEGGFDTIVADAGGIDTVYAAGDWTLGSGLENLFADDFVGTAWSFTGNELDNIMGSSSEGGSLFGMGGNDQLFLGNVQNFSDAHGGDGDDTLSAGRNSDLFGDAGNDVLLADNILAQMTGGTGNDAFVFTQAGSGAEILDFASSFDKIRLDAGGNMSALGASGNFTTGDARFHTGTAAHDANDRVIYNSSTGELLYDSDGTGSSAAVTIAVLQSGATVVSTDIAVDNGTAGGGSTINGTAGNDSLTGTSGDDTINGLAGNDTLNGGGGRDILDGGTGNDLVFRSGDPFAPDQGPSVLIGGDGNDTMVAAERFNFSSPTFDDTMIGGLGNDVFHVDSGDVISDSGGVDLVIAENGSWTLAAGFENLEIITDVPEWGTGIGNELANDMSISYRGELHGGAGNDTLHGGNSRSSLYGDDGHDLLFANYEFSTLDGGAGNDTLSGAFSFMTGGAGADVFASGEGSTFEDFASGVDTIRVDGAIFASSGPSGRFAAGDARFHTGTAAHDADDRVIYNSTTQELLYDADGNGSAAATTIATLQTGATVVATDIEVVNGTAPVGGQTINGTANNDTLVGGAGNDTINGNAGADLIQGQGGNDSLIGSTGWDTIQGGDGNDWMHGGGWSDTMTGGAGSDSFVWNDAGTGTRDTVTDFASGTDELLFDNAFFAALGANSAWAAGDGRFWAAAGATAGHDADDRLVYNTSNGNLYYDADGSGAGAAQVVATFQGGVSISASDITVV